MHPEDFELLWPGKSKLKVFCTSNANSSNFIMSVIPRLILLVDQQHRLTSCTELKILKLSKSKLS